MQIRLFLSIFISLLFVYFTLQQVNGQNEGRFLFPRVCSNDGNFQLSAGEIVTKVLGGQQVTPGEMPWMVKLEINSQSSAIGNCSGFLVNWRWLLTAAHCLINATSATVSAGRIDYSINSTAEVVMNVSTSDFYLHPEYSDHLNDIALIKLPTNLMSTNTIDPICILDSENDCQNIPVPGSLDENNCGLVFAAGWGATEIAMQSKVLRKINMTVVDQERCNRAYPLKTIGPSQMCAVGKQIDSQIGPIYEDTCKGDSGGPLMCKIDGLMTAVGIVSFGLGCGGGPPGVYTRICSYTNWMVNTMNINGCRIPKRENALFENRDTGSPLYAGSFIRVGTAISLTCDLNSNPNISSGMSVVSICQENGQLSPVLAECIPLRKQCGPLPYVENGHVETSSSLIDSGAIISCNNGYRLEGNNVILCLRNGQWSAPNGRCVATVIPAYLRCGPVPTIGNGSVANGSSIVGSYRNISCLPTFIIEGSSEIYCLNNGNWSEPGRCIIPIRPTSNAGGFCSNFLAVANGIVSEGNNEIYAVRSIYCYLGFRIQGNDKIVCLPSGQWNIAGTCVAIQTCNATSPVIGNGYMVDISTTPYSAGSRRKIICNSGFTLIGNDEIVCSSTGAWSLPGSCNPEPDYDYEYDYSFNVDSNLRLLGSRSGLTGEGFVLIQQHDGNWGTIGSRNFGYTEAEVVCRNLGYNLRDFAPVFANDRDVDFTIVSSYPIYLLDVNCIGNETNLLQCGNWGAGVNSSSWTKKAAVRCEPKENDLRLEGRRENNINGEGYLEAFHNGHWRAVCGDGGVWGLMESTVLAVCSIMGYQPFGAQILPRSSATRFNTPTYWSSVNLNFAICVGGGKVETCLDRISESEICSQGNAMISCNPTASAGVLRLVQESGNNKIDNFKRGARGFLEIFHNGHWGTVCNDDFGYMEARVACRQLGFISEYVNFSFIEYNIGFRNTPIHLNKIRCRGGESELQYCSHNLYGQHSCNHGEDIILDCSAEQVSSAPNERHNIRMSGSGIVGVGYVESKIGSVWSPLCSDVSPKVVAVACKQLGFNYSNAIVLPMVDFGFLSKKVTFVINPKGFICSGKESSLRECETKACDTNKYGAISCIGSNIASATNVERFQIAISMNDDREIERLLGLGDFRNFIFDRCCDENFLSSGVISSPALVCAAACGSYGAVRSLIKHGSNVHGTDKIRNATALYWTAVGSYISIVDSLIKGGINVNVMDRYSYTALHTAVYNNHFDLVKYLIEAGANPRITNANSQSSIDLSAGNWIIREYFKMNSTLQRVEVLDSIINGETSTVRTLLAQGFNSNFTVGKCCYYETAPPLLCATCLQRVEVLKLLIEQRTAIDGRDILSNVTSLMEATRNGNLEIVTWLVTHGANVNATAHYKYTPLMYASMYGHFDVVRYLVEHGADIEATDTNLKKAQDWALGTGYNEIASYLINAKSRLNSNGSFYYYYYPPNAN